jgi:hypothetical protein
LGLRVGALFSALGSIVLVALSAFRTPAVHAGLEVATSLDDGLVGI